MIFVFGMPRSGTTVFRKMLASAACCYEVGEVFQDKYENNHLNYFSFLKDAVCRSRLRVPDVYGPKPIRMFFDYIKGLHPDAMPVVDLKINALELFGLGPASEREGGNALVEYAASRDVRCVHLVRRNKLRRIVSERLAIATGMWGGDGAGPKGKPVPVFLDAGRIVSFAEAECSADEAFSKLLHERLECLTVEYEGMFDDDGAFSRRMQSGVARHLRITDQFARTPEQPKQNGGPLRELVSNFPEVFRAFEGSRHRWMVEEERSTKP